MFPPAALTWWNVAQNGDGKPIAVSSQTLIPRYARWLKRLRGSPVALSQGCCQGTVPCSSRARMRSVMTWYGVTVCVVGIRKNSMAVEGGCAGPAGSTRLPRGGALRTARAGLPSVVQELVRPALERGRRRGRLLIAAQAGHDVGGYRGPAGELGLERRDRGDGPWGGADPQEARGLVVLDGRIEHLCEERAQRIVPADDHRQAWPLWRDTVAT